MFDWNAALMLAQEGEAAGALFSLICMGGSCLISIPLLGFWIWMLVDAVKNEPSEGNDKMIWIIVIVLAGVLGAAVYYFVRRPQRIQQFGK